MSIDLSSLDSAFNDPALPSLSAPKAPLSKFEEDPDNPRTEFDDADFERFVLDIQERGILQPISVVEVGDKYRIKFGARRFRAALRLNLDEVPYFIIEDIRQLDDYSQVSENEQRKNLQPLDMAMFISKKIREGAKKKEIAEKLKIDPSAVTHFLAILELPPFLMELYHSRKCRTPQYLYQLKALHEKHADIVESLIAGSDVIDRQVIRAANDKIEQLNSVESPPGQSEGGQSDDKGSADNNGASLDTPGSTKSNVTHLLKPNIKRGNPDLIAELTLASSAISNVSQVSAQLKDHALFQDFDALMVEAKAALTKAMAIAKKIK